MNKKLPTAALATLLFASPAQALQLFDEAPFLHVLGRVVPDDGKLWEESVGRFKGRITTVVFHDCLGGTSTVGRAIGASIRELGMNTVIAGRSYSACANMFLGGVERRFSARMNERPTLLGYHGSYTAFPRTRELSRSELRTKPEYFKAMTNGKMPDATIERFIKLEQSSGFLYFIHPEQRTKEGEGLAFLCKGEESHLRRDEECERLPIDAMESGVVTSWDAVVTPPAPRERRGVTTWKSWD